MTEWLTHKIEEILDGAGYTLSTVPSPAGSKMGQAAPGRQDGSPYPHPFWKSWGLSACNSWPWANKRLSCLKKKKKTERSGEGNGNLLQYSCLENPLDRGAWWATVHGVARVGYDWTTDTHTQLRYLMVQGHTFSTLPSPAGSRMGQAAPGRQGDSPHPHPFWKSWGFSACNSWPWANKRLSCLKKKKKLKGP